MWVAAGALIGLISLILAHLFDKRKTQKQKDREEDDQILERVSRIERSIARGRAKEVEFQIDDLLRRLKIRDRRLRGKARNPER